MDDIWVDGQKGGPGKEKKRRKEKRKWGREEGREQAKLWVTATFTVSWSLGKNHYQDQGEG